MVAKRLGVTSLVIVMAGLAFQALASDEVLLRYKYKKGDRILYHMVIDQQLEVENSLIPDSTRKMGSRLKVDFFHRVLLSEGNRFGVEMGFDKFEAAASVGPTPIPLPGLAEIKNIKLQMNMSDRGKMEDVRLLNTATLGQNAQRLAEQIRTALPQNALIFPEKKLNKGDKWEVAQRLPASIPGASKLMMDLKTSYVYQGMFQYEDVLAAKIDTTITLALHGSSKQQGIVLQTDMEGKGTGSAHFLPDQGRLYAIELEFFINGRTAGQHQGKDFASTMKITTNYKLNLK